MVGPIQIQVKTKRLQYNIQLQRNITIIRGDSGIGKTVLVNLVADFYNKQTHVTVITKPSNCKVAVLQQGYWREVLSNAHNTIFFIDESEEFITTNQFAVAVAQTDNWFVIVGRNDFSLQQIPYSITEIYTLRTSGKYVDMKQVIHYTTNVPIWNAQNNVQENFKPTKILTEDSGSGYTFYRRFVKDDCISAEGNSNVVPVLRKLARTDNVLVVLDGAAFGCYLTTLLLCQEVYGNNIRCFFQESFEWFLLYSIIFKRYAKIQQMLSNPVVYIDSAKYVSWERYFEDVLRNVCKTTGFVYTKGRRLNRIFTTKSNVKHLLTLLQNIDFTRWQQQIEDIENK